MTAFPEDLADWLDTFGDAAEFSPAPRSAIDDFADRGFDVPESLRQLWAEFGSCRFAGEATITGTTIRVWTVHGLDDSRHGLFHVWHTHPDLERDGLVPVLSDMDGNVVAWSAHDGSVVAVKYHARPGETPGTRVPFYASIDDLWAGIAVTEHPHPDTSQLAPVGTYPGATADEDPVGLVRDHTVTRTFTNHLCLVLDTDEGQPFAGDLDARGLGSTPTCVNLMTIDDRVTVTLAEAGVRAEPSDLALVWDGTLSSPTREIGVMDPDGLIVMYVAAEAEARVRIWTDRAQGEPSEVVVLVG